MTIGKPRRARVATALVGLLLAAGVLPSIAGSGTGAPAAQDPAALDGDAERGAALFTDYTCYGCHGYTGETGRGPRLNPPRLRQDRFIAYLRNPPNPRRMPPYRQAEASDRKLADIHAFLVSLPSASPAAEDIPVLQEILRETRPSPREGGHTTPPAVPKDPTAPVGAPWRVGSPVSTAPGR